MTRNNCESCRHKANGGEGHCYMFRTEPTLLCMQHPARAEKSVFVSEPYRENFGRYLVVTSMANLMVRQTKLLNGMK